MSNELEQELYAPEPEQQYPDEQGEEVDFLTGIAPACSLEEGCESCQ